MLRKTLPLVGVIALTAALFGCQHGRSEYSAPDGAEADTPQLVRAAWTPVHKGAYTFYKECPDCHGEGVLCDKCNGTGQSRQYIGDIMGGDGTVAFPCPYCLGGVQNCATCNAKHYELHPEDFLTEEEQQAYISRLSARNEIAKTDHAFKLEHIAQEEAQARREKAERDAQTYHNAYQQ